MSYLFLFAMLIGEVPKDYESAIELAKKENKDIVIVFGAEWCPWCGELHDRTLTRLSIKKKLKQFVYLELDTDKCPKYILQKYRVRSLPFYIIIDIKGKVLKKGVGFREESRFLEWLDEHLRSVERRNQKGFGWFKQRNLHLRKSRLRKISHSRRNFRRAFKKRLQDN